MPDTGGAITQAAPAPLEAARGEGGWYRHAPNSLTVLRLVLAAAFFALLTPWKAGDRLLTEAPHSAANPNWWLLAAAGLFILGTVTDALDGALARRWNVVTAFGRVMDPFADKVLVVGAFIFLAGPSFHYGEELRGRTPSDYQVSGVEPWMVVVCLARELLVTSIRAVLEGRGIAFPAGWSGKAKMILQSAAIPIILGVIALTDARPATTGRYLIDGLVWVTMIVTVVSGIPYVTRAMTAFKQA